MERSEIREHRAPIIPDSAVLHPGYSLAQDWPRFVVMEVDQPLVARAGDYADTFALRGYDGVQLAAAFETGRIAQTPVCFACFDTRLNKAARVLGMTCL